MKIKFLFLLVLISSIAFSQDKTTAPAFKKRVLESTEVDFLASYYNQDGSRSAVSGGIGSEKLTDIASNIVVAMPLNDDDVLTIDLGISAYSSASSSNINPFNSTGASSSGGPSGTPWQASSGASKSDQLVSIVANYSHSSDSRNFIWNTDVSFSNEYDYTSVGFGGGIATLFNEKNTELSLKANVYLDQWRPIYPTELDEYSKYGANFLNQGYFNGVSVLDQNGQTTTNYLPSAFQTVSGVNRNSYSASVGFSQVLTKKLQFSIFFDILQQQGLLSSPYHRIYFADKANYYIGQAQYISTYESSTNTGVYKLADDIERLPDSRFKIPVGARLNYYINERFILRTYYRFYSDNWDIQSHTATIELPIKLSDRFTVFPMYRYYTQTASKYYAPYETHLSTERYYTSDADLATFDANQYGFGINYTDIFTGAKIWKFGLKNIDFRFNHYERSDNLNANIGTIAFKFAMQ
ncbi:DUF3570 domain-containing protein [Flavobacterium glaciei]|uniref:Uncharacterized protein DUF3570 n=1 Tax=Flavobacterium glaciei TaxID=386300 RepID=A0A562PQC8_9FLAO|nr:DUF3570 domain-containing protein [Flavobacterium glaciei]RDI53488.1 uncharacterized protein DUF3570 [Flavobacterium glaciei]TWI46390.1 uncharacterized protein DUF3570 [Flavobacterium glaciei]